MNLIDHFDLKGKLHGRAEIFKGLKMTFRRKTLKKKHTTLISIKNTTNFILNNFSLRPLFIFCRAPNRGQFHQTRGEHQS